MMSIGTFTTGEILANCQLVHTKHCLSAYSVVSNSAMPPITSNIKYDTQEANHMTVTYAAKDIDVSHINIYWRKTKDLRINVPCSEHLRGHQH